MATLRQSNMLPEVGTLFTSTWDKCLLETHTSRATASAASDSMIYIRRRKTSPIYGFKFKCATCGIRSLPIESEISLLPSSPLRAFAKN